MNNKIVSIIAIVALVVGLIATGVSFFKGTSDQSIGGLSERDVQAVSLKVGDKGSKITKEITGTCNASMATTLAATSTANATCTVAGVASGDKVFVSLPSVSGGLGFAVTHTVASTNTITFGILNLSGAATTSFPLATTSVQYWVLR